MQQEIRQCFSSHGTYIPSVAGGGRQHANLEHVRGEECHEENQEGDRHRGMGRGRLL